MSSPAGATSAPESIAKFWDLVDNFSDCTLVTKDKNSDKLKGRPMAPKIFRDRRQIIFLFDKQSNKKAEVESCEQVCLTFSKPGTWLSVSGRAHITSDKELIDAAWGPEFDIWMPGGKTDPNIACMEIKPDTAEFWDTTANKLTQMWEFGQAYVGMKAQPDVSDNQRVTLQ